jgi:methylenetetrahydrofolate reductase (NADPH)
MIATYPEQLELQTTEEPEADETLQPLTAISAQVIGSQLVPISFEIVGASSDNPSYNQYAYAAEVLFNNMDPDFVSVAKIPYPSDDGHSKCLDTAAAHGEKSKIVPVITLDGSIKPDVQFDHVSVAMNRYRNWGIDKVLVKPHRLEQAGEAMWIQSTAKLTPILREVGQFDSIGVVVYPERTATTTSIDEDYDRIAEELSVADFGITSFILNAAPYVKLVREMRRREVTTPVLPGIKPFRQYNQIKAIEKAGYPELGDELMHIMPPSPSRSDIMRQSEDLMSYFIGMGFDLVKHLGAPGLHIYTDNNVRAAQRLAQGVQQAVNSL